MKVERELRLVRGPLFAELDLQAALSRELAPPTDGSLLHPLPLRVLVPSRSLAQHLGAVLTRRAGRPLVGLRIDTLRGLAHELLDVAGESVVEGDLALGAISERAARRQSELRRDLSDFRDGFASVTAGVRDLVDAGFRREQHGPALREAIAESRASAVSRRASALVEVAGEVEGVLDEHGVDPVARLFQRAAGWLAEDVDGRSGARALFVFGFANATGAVLDFLMTLLRHSRATLWVDRPPDPCAEPEEALGEATPGGEHLRRLLESAQGLPAMQIREVPVPRSASSGGSGGPAPAAGPRLWRAAGARAEVRAVAGAIDELLAAGARPESIAVVARDTAPYARVIARTFRGLGIPFSALSTHGATTPFGRRSLALVELLRARADTRVERWLDLLGRASFLQDGERRHSRADLASGLAQLGVARLAQLVELDPATQLEGERTRLSAARGFTRLEQDPTRVVLGRRRIDHQALEAARARARQLLAHPALGTDDQTVGRFLRDLRDLVRTQLEWKSAFGDAALWKQALAALAPLARMRFPAADRITLLEAALEAQRHEALGGRGGGVALLTVTEARSRTAEHLFVLGMNRGVFPRRPREDPLLSDELRRNLRVVLPDLPLKLEAHDEERYLFAQLLASSPNVTLSWQGETDDGKALAPSSLVEQLVWQGRVVEDVAPLDIAPGGDHARRASPVEHVQRAALQASAQEFEALLPFALDTIRPAARRTELPSSQLARARCAVLGAHDPKHAGEGLGPYYGSVGPLRLDLDPRHNAPYVTRLERLAICGWQQFLQGVLRLERAADPLERLPAIEARSVGNLVHSTVESWIRESVGDAPEGPVDWERLPAEPVAAPSLDALERIARRHAQRMLHTEGIPFAGMVEALVQCARPHLERLIALEGWNRRAPRLCGAELSGEVTCQVAGRDVPLAFRADVVDRTDKGLRLTDLKTGQPISDTKTERGRAGKIAASVRRGEKLQAMAYALASGGTGRYVFLGDGTLDANAVVEFETSQTELVQAFRETTAVLLEARAAGAYLPRVVTEKLDKAPPACRFCDVSNACHATDSGYRARFVQWAQTHEQDADPSSTPVEERWFGLR